MLACLWVLHAWLWMGALPAGAEGPAPLARLVFVGDIMVGRHIGEIIASEGMDYPFEAVAPFLAAADLAYGNMESPLTTAPRVARGYNLQADPGNADVVSLAGFDVLSLANNHATDNGREGLLETMKMLSDRGIDYVGAGSSREEVHSPLVKEVNGLRIGFLAYEGLRVTLQATDDEAGTAWLDVDVAGADVESARPSVDVLIVSMHVGVEYESLPTAYQRRVAQRLADAGADLIIGHHPHVVQPIEWVQGKGRPYPTLVAYSLGNFIFDQWFSDEVMQSAILTCVVGEQGVVAFGLQPTLSLKAHTAPADAAHGQAVLERLLPDPPDTLWQRATPADSELAPTPWWLSPAAVMMQEDGLVDLDGEGFPERVVCGDGGLWTYVEGNVTLASPSPWRVSHWSVSKSVLADGAVSRHLILSVWEPPAWGGVRKLTSQRLWKRSSHNGPAERLYVLGWSDDRWQLVGRSEPLDHALVDFACQEGIAGELQTCVGIEMATDGRRRLAGWQWDGTVWRRAWTTPAASYEALLRWDIDGDGRLDVLALDRS